MAGAGDLRWCSAGLPVGFAGSSYDWTLITSVVPGLAITGTIIGILASIALLSAARPGHAEAQEDA